MSHQECPGEEGADKDSHSALPTEEAESVLSNVEEEGGVSKENEIAESSGRLESESSCTKKASGSSTAEEALCGGRILHSVARQVLQSYGGKESSAALPDEAAL